LGAFRALVACSNANAIFNSVGSLHARPKNEIPTGSPNRLPAVTLFDTQQLPPRSNYSPPK
jgi:hypothetical protein